MCVCVQRGGRCLDGTKTRFLHFLGLISYLDQHRQVGYTGLGVCAPRHTQKHPRRYTLTVSDPLPLARPTSPLPVRSQELDHLGKEAKELLIAFHFITLPTEKTNDLQLAFENLSAIEGVQDGWGISRKMVSLRWTWGLLVLCVVAASPPRYGRQSELDDYTDNNVEFGGIEDVPTGPPSSSSPPESCTERVEVELDRDRQAANRPVEFEPLIPDEENNPSFTASLDENEEEEIQFNPEPVPVRSEEAGTLMGPSAQGEEELRLTPTDILQISGDLGSADVTSGDLSSDRASGSGEASGSGSSGASGDISGSEDSGDLGSAVSGLSGSGIIFFSGGEEELHPKSEILPFEASGEFEESGIPWVSGISGLTDGSGELATTGVIVLSGAQEGLGEIETSGVSGVSGLPEGSAESGFSGLPEGSGESGVSGIPEGSAESGVSGIPELSGESGVPDESGESGFTGIHDLFEISGSAGELDISGLSGTSGFPEVTLRPEIITSGIPEESEESGVTEAPEITSPILIPEEEEFLFTTPITPLEGAGGDIGSGIPDIDTDFDITGMSTCVLCTCLVGSVYCDDLKLDRVPPLTKETTHFYGRYNKVSRISKSDFANLNKLKRIDLTSNGISRIDDDAFFGLPALEELILRENSIRQLPALPPSMILIDASLNQLGSNGIQREAFKDMSGLLYLYLTDDNIDHIPVPLPDSLRSLHLQNNNIQMIHEDTFCNPHNLNYIRRALEDIRLDGNPINLSRTPQAYVCLPRIPIGALI
ncbi:hypothetical protein DNTS_006487 [Danionella cerebrum]|uniref:LRRNT domain-containing protein n=1 Tax=Danionella cerebrum TaxID=2873325 RepID=A0A553QKW7_9TELE|nr:hypothetical protein DNTS_006487 [Danionella translucida]